MTPHFDYWALTPELIIASTLAVVLLVDLFISEKRRNVVALVSLLGTVAAFAVICGLGSTGHHARMSGAYTVDSFSLLAKAFFTVSASVVLLLGLPDRWKGEYCQLILASVLGMMALSSSRDLITFFVSFELFALPGYLLTGWNKKTTAGSEAALKYFLQGAMATAVMLYGLSFLYGLSGGTSFAAISASLNNGGSDVALARISVLLVLVGMGFKISAVPVHFWAPDAYQGAPIPVAAYLSVASKVAGFVALLVVVNVAFPSARNVWAPILFGFAVASMLVGNLVALKQTDAVRLLAYSSIGQTGFILVPLAVAHGSGVQRDVLTSTFEYLMIYAIASAGAFAVIIAATKNRTTDLTSFHGLFHRSPGLAAALTICLISLAGIPPLGGWFAKFVVVRDAIATQTVPSVTLAAIASVATALGLVFYLGFIRRLWLDPEANLELHPESEPADSPSIGLGLVIALACSALVVLGVLPALITHVGGMSSLLN